MYFYKNTCIADHRATIRGPFARLRNYLWWKRHDRCLLSSDMKRYYSE